MEEKEYERDLVGAILCPHITMNFGGKTRKVKARCIGCKYDRIHGGCEDKEKILALMGVSSQGFLKKLKKKIKPNKERIILNQREDFIKYLNKVPFLKYKGRGMNDGVWDSDETFIDFTHPISFNVYSAFIRITLYGISVDKYGMCVKVEMNAMHVCDWETMFEGQVRDVYELRHLLIHNLCLPIDPSLH